MLREAMGRLDVSKVPDRGTPKLPLLSEGVALVADTGAYQGDYIHDWIQRELKQRGVVRFGRSSAH